MQRAGIDLAARLGVAQPGAFNAATKATNPEMFCTGCHEIRDNVFAELGRRAFMDRVRSHPSAFSA